MADQLAKMANTNEEPECYNMIPKSAVRKKLRAESIEKWENEWQNTTKGEETKRYFPTVAQRLQQRIPLTSKLTTMLTGHGRLKAY